MDTVVRYDIMQKLTQKRYIWASARVRASGKQKVNESLKIWMFSNTAESFKIFSFRNQI